MPFRTRGMIVAGVLSLAAAPVWAQSPGTARFIDWCANTPASSASAACGHKAYERWGDGSPARAAGAASRRDPPRYFTGGYSRFYGFGR